MYKNTYGGLLVVFDGPNGVGKSTIVEELYNRLNENGYLVEKTKEPTESSLGKFVREESEKVAGITLACLIAADRYQHIEEKIKPMLKENKIILCDRYILSSYILQGMDGVKEEFIYNINHEIITPNIQFSLIASSDTIQTRLARRTNLTRFEKGNKTKLELDFLEYGLSRLKKEEISTYTFNTEEDMYTNLNKMYDIILSHFD